MGPKMFRGKLKKFNCELGLGITESRVKFGARRHGGARVKGTPAQRTRGCGCEDGRIMTSLSLKRFTIEHREKLRKCGPKVTNYSILVHSAECSLTYSFKFSVASRSYSKLKIEGGEYQNR